jgi:hypothetical protein
VSKLMQRMREELVRRHYAESTILSYLRTVEDFRQYIQKRLDHPGLDDIRRIKSIYSKRESSESAPSARTLRCSPAFLRRGTSDQG